LHSECTAMLLPITTPTRSPLLHSPPSTVIAGYDPQSPIHRQGSYISTNVSHQSIRGFFFLFALRGREYHVKPARTSKGGRGGVAGRIPSLL
ncbi:MAG: hypothetical protein ACRCZB_00230, partial [Bacteroidales bacterium]